MIHADVVVGEVSEQRAREFPCGIAARAGGNVAELRGNHAVERQCLLSAVQAAGDDGEVHGKVLLILDNLRLLGKHAHVRGIALPLVVEQHRELCGYRGLHDIAGQRVVAVDVALHEVGKVEFGCGFHLQGYGIEFAHLRLSVTVGEVQRAAEAVCRHCVGSGILRRYEEDCCHALALCAQRPGTVHAAREAVDALEVYLELVARSLLAEQVAYEDVKLDARELAFRIVVDGQRAAESLSREHELLLNLQFHACAYVGGCVFVVFEYIPIGTLHEFLPVYEAEFHHCCQAAVLTLGEDVHCRLVHEVVARWSHAVLDAVGVHPAVHVASQAEVVPRSRGTRHRLRPVVQREPLRRCIGEERNLQRVEGVQCACIMHVFKLGIDGRQRLPEDFVLFP